MEDEDEELDLPPVEVIAIITLGGHYKINECYLSTRSGGRTYEVTMTAGTDEYIVRVGSSGLLGYWNLWACSENFPDSHWETMQPMLKEVTV